MKVDLAVIGGGPAGLAAAIAAHDHGVERIVVIERENILGGILNQCIHHGFGLHTFGEELTGPEYGGRYVAMLEERGIPFLVATMITAIDKSEEKINDIPYSRFHLTAMQGEQGSLAIEAQAIMLAMGCRERPRGALNIPGHRPAGIFTAGCAQRFVNIDGFLPGKSVVILGSGDIGLIMARRMKLQGADVKMVVEIMSYSGGLTRNVVQCLEDFDIPLKMNHTITDIHGTNRLEGVTVSAVDKELNPIPGTAIEVACDTLLLSCGLIPENELSRAIGVEIDEVTGGAVVNSSFETTVRGVFSCGNVLHVHDLVDNVSIEAKAAGIAAAKYLSGVYSGEIPSWGEAKRPKLPPKSRFVPREKYEENEITCIGCPKSCLIRAEIDHHPSTTFADGLDGDALQLSGHLCAVDTEGANFSELHLSGYLCAVDTEGANFSELHLSGYLCAVGYEYAHKELTAPHRNLTSLVHVVGGERTVVSVKTTTPVPKESIFTCIEEIAKTTAAAPINRGDVLIKNIAGTGADVVATADITAVIPTTLQEKICPI